MSEKLDTEQEYVLKRIASLLDEHKEDSFIDPFKEEAFTKIKAAIQDYFDVKRKFNIIDYTY